MQKVFSELQRRNVFRVASIYAITGWLLMQLAVVLETTLLLPAWFDTFVTILVIIGFPIAVIFAWSFELTPDGIRPTARVSQEESIASRTGRRLDLVIAVAAAALVLVIVGDRFLPSDSMAKASTLAKAGEFSIAVLPFADMSPQQDQEYFADGISEELLNVLAQVPDLAVAGRTSSFAFKGKNQDLREIGQLLDVAHVLEGSVRKSGNTIRVTAQLVRTDNGFHLWSDTYDRDLIDIFAVQDEIANAILTALKPQLLGEIETVAAPRTDISSYDLYLLAQQKAAAGDMAGYEAATEALDSALSIDPDFVPALAWRGYYELMMSDGDGAAGDIPIEEALERAGDWTGHALALDPASADALFARAGWLSMSFDAEDRAQAERYYELALKEKPNFPLARNDYGYLLNRQGRVDEAVEQLEIALAHDPAQNDVNTNLAAHFMRLRDFDRVEALIGRWEAISPENTGPLGFRSLMHMARGELAQSYLLNKKVLERAPADPRAKRYMFDSLGSLGEFDKVLTSGIEDMEVVALRFLGRKDEAIDRVTEHLAERPDFPFVQSDYVSAHYFTGEWDEVVRFYNTAWGDKDAFESGYDYPPYGIVAPPATGGRTSRCRFVGHCLQNPDRRSSSGRRAGWQH
ncbi:MAG: tetratricopeptide repeat protein [Henriciella sp.]|uniref:tetratricopeptide repeat protein n=1 Tax=Henriciella sp. TaxID=1968823 RepID=UPI003C7871F7